MAQLISLNIERSRHLDRFIPFLQAARPDVVCLQELSACDIPAIKTSTGLAFCHYVQMAIHPSDGHGFGVAILARAPFVATDLLTYAGAGDGNTHFDRTSPESRIASCRYVAVVAQLDIAGQRLAFATTHFPWTPDGEPRPFQETATRRLIGLLGDREIALTGDFNAPRGGPIFAELARTWTDNIPAGITSSLDPELHRARGVELMVDGLFTSPHFRAEDVALRSGLSDHQGVTARIMRAD